MSKELVTAKGGTLSVGANQDGFSDRQVAALRHMGVEHANEADLEVFFHIVKRTGLDPFAKQIHMIERMTSEPDGNGGWHKVPKSTIQTGIDGYRLIGRRAADRANHTLSVSAPEWAHEDGSWRPVWARAWGRPVAARVTVARNGHDFTAVANFDEYAQTKRSGELNSMWAQRSGGQIAKCAEALAWRMAFPQDLAGLYTDDEMHQADSSTPAPSRATADDVLAAPEPVESDPEEVEAEMVEDDPVDTPDAPAKATTAQVAQIKRGVTANDIGNEAAKAMVQRVTGRADATTANLTGDEATAILAELAAFEGPAAASADTARAAIGATS